MKPETAWWRWWPAGVVLILAVAGGVMFAATTEQQEPAPVPAPVVSASPVTPSFDVTDFGAKGDDGLNDEAAILRAIAAADGAPVYFPAGNYLVDRAFELPEGTFVRGDVDTSKQSYLLAVIAERDGDVSWKFTWIRP